MSINSPKRRFPYKARLPAEWEAQSATWLSFFPPDRADLWRGAGIDQLVKAREQWFAFVARISLTQKVRVLARDYQEREIMTGVATANGDTTQVVCHAVDIDDVWARDYLGLFIECEQSKEATGCSPIPPKSPKARETSLALVNPRFDAWGGKFAGARDDAAARRVAEILGLELFNFDAVLEGGAIESNGAGLLLCTESSVLRGEGVEQKHMQKEIYEDLFTEYFGIKKVLWFDAESLSGDDTDGHIDTLARFVAEKVVVGICPRLCNKVHPDFEKIERNWQKLERLCAHEGLNLLALSHPEPKKAPPNWRHEFLPANFCNFLITNRQVLVPFFGEASEDRNRAETAAQVLAESFPTRETHLLNASALILEGGALHCLSMQEPSEL